LLYQIKLRDEETFGVCKNKTLRRIFGAQRADVTEGWKQLHDCYMGMDTKLYKHISNQ
jgi:hypothetical protein